MTTPKYPSDAAAAERAIGAETALLWRHRQAEALTELDGETDPDLRRYLTARANQAGCEAVALERFAETGDWRTPL